MARARNIKPGFFLNDELAEVAPLGRLLFAGLWLLADREGRIEDRPKKIKAEIFPYDDCDVDMLLDSLMQHGFISRYEAQGIKCIQVVNFTKHQNPHPKEAKSVLPAEEGHIDSGFTPYYVPAEQRKRIMERDGNKCVACGATENLCIDHIIPRSKGGSNKDDNLQTLCKSCNSRKGTNDKVERNLITRKEISLHGKQVAKNAESPILNPLSLNPLSLKPESPILNPESSVECADAHSPTRAREEGEPVDSSVDNCVDKMCKKRFKEFWEAYPRKTGKGAAEKAYEKISPSKELHETMIRAVRSASLSRQWTEENGRFIPNPATWLNQKRWEDELPVDNGYSKQAAVCDRAIAMLETIEEGSG